MKIKLKKTIVHWINRFGEKRQHTLFDCSYHYALNWLRENILECQGTFFMTTDEKRNSKLELVKIEFIS